jgi:hypothetical protein
MEITVVGVEGIHTPAKSLILLKRIFCLKILPEELISTFIGYKIENKKVF